MGALCLEPGTVYEAQDGTFDIVEPYEPERYKAERAEAAAASSSSAAVPAAAAGYPTGGSNGVTDAEYDDLLVWLSGCRAPPLSPALLPGLSSSS